MVQSPEKMQNPELPQYDSFYSKLRSCNPLETEYTTYVNLLKSGLTTEQAVIKLKLSKPPPTGIATDLQAKTKELIQRHFAVVQH